jgi:selenoprotein W-related protein
VSAEIKDVTGHAVTLIPGSGGVFEIRRDGELIFSKSTSKRFPDVGETAQLL